MIKNKFLALAMACAMTLATAVPAFATGNTTTVSLTVAPTNTYTMKVPAAMPLDSTGEATALSGGIQITNGDLEEGKKLTVTAESANEWKMTAEGKTTTIRYSLYSDAGTTAATTWEFEKDEAKNGTTKAVYAKANADDLKAAASGTYSDVITFTATLGDAVNMVSFTVNGAECSVAEGTTWSEFVAGQGSSVVAIEAGSVVLADDHSKVVTDETGIMVSPHAVITGQYYTVMTMGS